MAASAPQMETLRIEREAAVARVVLDRPDIRNAFNDVMIRELREALAAPGHIVLVGAAGSGKTTVVQQVAERLGNHVGMEDGRSEYDDKRRRDGKELCDPPRGHRFFFLNTATTLGRKIRRSPRRTTIAVYDTWNSKASS